MYMKAFWFVYFWRKWSQKSALKQAVLKSQVLYQAGLLAQPNLTCDTLACGFCPQSQVTDCPLFSEAALQKLNCRKMVI